MLLARRNEGEVQHVFVKTSRDAHFVAQGTAIESLRCIGKSVSEAIESLKKHNVSSNVIRLIHADLKKLEKQNARYYIITAINHEKTPSLTRMLNLITEGCFNNDLWLSTAGDIGVRDIEVGRELPKLPFKRPRGQAGSKGTSHRTAGSLLHVPEHKAN